MNNEPLVTIIVPTRNRGQLLQVCLEAIKEQTYTNYEVLVLDDGSSKECRNTYYELVANYDQRVKWHKIHSFNTLGSGASVVRNIGIKLAKGKYITFCDDDDYWCRKDHLYVAISTMEQQKIEAYFAGIKVEDSFGQVAIEQLMPNVEKKLREEQKIQGVGIYNISSKQMLSYPDYAHLNIIIISKNFINSIAGFWEQTRYAEDVDLFVRICDSTDNVLFRPEICAVHNAPQERKDNSISNQLSQYDKLLLEINVYQHLLMVCNNKPSLDYTRKSLSTSLKLATDLLAKENKNSSTLDFARCAFGIYPTLKWFFYTCYLSFSDLFK